MSSDFPLAGVRVLDFTIAMAGPLAAQRLGDMGAEVIKVEPRSGDLTRVFVLQDLRLGEDTTSYLALNRNKRSFAVDLKKPGGLDVILDLVAESDVVFQNFRPGVAERLGIGYEALKAINPRIVYMSISGYGEEGPMAKEPGQDLLVQGFSGLTFSAGEKDGRPHPAPTYFVDTCASHLATEGILAALFQRERTGLGQHVKTNLLNAALEAQSQEVMTCMLSGRVSRRTRAPYASVWLDPPYGIYRTADGWLALPQNDMKKLAELVSAPELGRLLAQRPPVSDEKATDEWRSECFDLLSEALLARTTDDWMARLSPEKIWCGRVQDIADFIKSEQARFHTAVIDHPEHGPIPCVAPAIAFSSSETQRLQRPPPLGADNEAILEALGYSEDRIGELRRNDVIP